jgi:hypothetical protein
MAVPQEESDRNMKRTIHTLQEAGPDKRIHLCIPVEQANSRYRLTIVIEPETPLPAATPEELGWPPGFFEQTYGAIADDTFVRHPQGEFEQRPEME